MTERDPEQLTVAPNHQPFEKQPRWRQDFPIDWPQDEYISRREFIKFLLLTSGAFTAGQFLFLIRSFFQTRQTAPPAMAIVPINDLPVGGSLLFKYPENSPARLLVRMDETTLVAYEQQCTHLTCPVIPEVEKGELHCPCHEGVFDLRTGRPLAGPPQRPLARVILEVREGMVFATGIEERTV